MKTIVISDIHLGIDDRISETVKNRSLLISFLEKLRREKAADEHVINGDFLDQWYLPGSYEHVTDSDEFYRACAKNNQAVIDAFQAVIRDGIRVVYVPGNHDMTLSYQILSELLPGILQARDVRGLGRYRTGTRGEAVIEHCHRYESFCAPDMLSNKSYMKYGEPILPPGYFFALVGVQWFAEGKPAPHTNLWEIPVPEKTNKDQMEAYGYYKFWRYVAAEKFPVKEAPEDAFIKVNVDGFQGTFSIDDIVPKQTKEGITAKLYAHMQRNWDELQRRNLVPSPVNLLEQFSRMGDQGLRAEYAKQEYFDLDPTVDVVVFGHTHVPFFREYTEGYDKKKVYVNTGTWVDNNLDDPDNTAVFAELESGEKETEVRLLKCVGDGELSDIVPVKNQYV